MPMLHLELLKRTKEAGGGCKLELWPIQRLEGVISAWYMASYPATYFCNEDIPQTMCLRLHRGATGKRNTNRTRRLRSYVVGGVKGQIMES